MGRQSFLDRGNRPHDGRDPGTAKDWPGWSRGSKGERVVRGGGKVGRARPAGLVGQVRVFYLKNINKPVNSFKQRSDMIRFVLSNDHLDWIRVRIEAGAAVRSFCSHLGRR